MRKLLVLGCGDNGKVVAQNVLECENFDEIKFLDDDYKSSNKFDVIGPLKDIFDAKIKSFFPNAIISISNFETRMYWLNLLKREEYHIPKIIHKSAYVSKTAKIGSGSIIYPKACIQTNANIGEAVLINTNSCIEHDCKISDGVHICPGVNIAGKAKIGKGSWIGIGSTIIQNIEIGHNTIIGAGAVVIRNIPNNSKAIGNPARLI